MVRGKVSGSNVLKCKKGRGCMTLDQVQFVLPTKKEIFQNLSGLLEQLEEFLTPELCEHSDAILAKFDVAVDAVLAINVPQIPDSLEVIMDSFLGKYIKNAARKLRDRMCGK